MYEIGKVSAQILFDRILKHNQEKPREIILSEKLMIRKSTSPPKGKNMRTSDDCSV